MNDLTDFTGNTTRVQQSIRGLKGATSVTLKGVARWKITDDSGALHEILIPNTYYCESLPFCILSPQHWDRTCKAKHRGRARSLTDDDCTLLFWSDQDGTSYIKTIEHDARTKVPIFRFAPGYSKFSNYL